MKWIVLAALLASACTLKTIKHSRPDSGGTVDAGRQDAGPTDASAEDGAVADAGCTPQPETCNGEDEDCDGAVDEGLIGPVGEPVSVGQGFEFSAGGASLVDVDAFETGYVVVWTSSSDKARLSVLNPDGGRSGLSVVVDDSIAGVHGGPVVETIADSRAVLRAVVGFRASDALWVRSIPLDGSPAPASTMALPGGGIGDFDMFAVGGKVVVVIKDSFAPEPAVLARVVDPTTGQAEGDIVAVFPGSPTLSMTPGFARGAVDEGQDALLLGTYQQRAGDLTDFAYVQRFVLDPEIGSDAEPLRTHPDSERSAIATIPLLFRDSLDGLLLVRTDDMAEHPYDVAGLTAGAVGTPPTVSSFDRRLAMPERGLVADSDVGRGDADIAISVLMVGVGYQVWHSRVGREGTEGTEPWMVAADNDLKGLAVAGRNETDAALVYMLESEGVENSTTFFQRVGCSP